VRTATTANVGTYTATAGLRGQITGAPNVLDGVTLIATNRILVKNSTNGAANGIYSYYSSRYLELTVYGIELLILTQILR
jgi:hypothetical protein